MFSIYVRCVIGIECLLMTSNIHAQPQLERGLQDAVVREGDNVEFVCDLTSVSGYNVYWLYIEPMTGKFQRYLTLDREVLTNPRLLQLEQRLSIIGDESQNEFTLRITNVQATDDGTYSCRYSASGISARSVGEAELTVLVPPSPQSPLCSVEPASGAVGDDVYLECGSQRGKPSPNITYYKENEIVAGPATSIRHQYQLKAKDNGVTFTCIMTTPALDEPRNCFAMPLRIVPTATILPAVSRVEEGTSTSFQCNGEGLPNINSYSWKVIDTETEHTLPTERYTVSEDGQTLEIAVMGNLELVCIVSVPSGLTGNSSKLFKVTEREHTTEIVGKGRTASPTGESSMSLIVPIAAVVGVVVIIMLIVLVILVRRRKKQRQPKIPIDSKDGFRMRVAEGENDELKPGQDGHKVGIGLPHEADSQGTVNGAEAFSGAASHSEPDTRAKANGKDVRSHVEPPAAAHQDIPMYAQLDKPKNAKKTEEVTRSEYSSVPVEEPEPTAADFGLVYADLDLQSPGTATVDTGPASASEQTVYAMIRT